MSSGSRTSASLDIALPGHFDVLYGDPDANALACSAVGIQGGPPTVGKGAEQGGGQTADTASAVLCVTFHEGDALSDSEGRIGGGVAGRR